MANNNSNIPSPATPFIGLNTEPYTGIHTSLNCNNSEHLHTPNTHIFNIESTDNTKQQEATLNKGEVVMPYAPSVELPNGNTAIPQHYLRFEHTLTSIQQIISDITPMPLTPIFADKDDGGCYIQVGIIGKENYDRNNTSLPKKIVYGRKWRIEPHTPTSEIIQTAFLAVKKVWEHELREFFLLKEERSGKTSALFSCHHDLPLMANNSELITESNPNQQTEQWTEKDITDIVKRVSLKTHAFKITEILVRKRNVIVDIDLTPLKNNDTTNIEVCDGLSRFDAFSTSLVLSSCNPSELLYALMDALIAYSDNIVEDTFCYQQFARFSREHDPRNIAALSIASRPYKTHMQDNTFASTFEKINYETDSCRVPNIGNGVLADKNRHIISLAGELTGHLPNGFTGE